MDEILPTILVVFGITGDLSHRYLLPAVEEIAKLAHLAKKLRILGVSRQEAKPEAVFRDKSNSITRSGQTFQMDYSQPPDYKKLKSKLVEMDREFNGQAQIIFYFAVPPEEVPKIVRMMGDAGLNSANTKLLLEKPFGTDLASAKKLIEETAEHYPEEQVYRIDHYLAKEMAQNITVFLGSNTLFRDVWNKQFIESIEITAAEKISIEGRVNFYEGTGAVRDIVQSHLLQLAALTLMEPCSDIFDFAEIPRRRLAALESIEPANPAKALRRQYETYRSEVDNPKSTTETFVDMYISSKDPRWSGVPVRLTTGKCLDAKLTQVTIRFKKTSANAANMLILRIQPDEGIEIDLWIKEPGYERRLQKLPLSFSYGSHFKRLPDAYEQVLVDAMRSNHSLFASSGEVLASWKILQPLIKKWSQSDLGLFTYKCGSTVDEVVSDSTNS